MEYSIEKLVFYLRGFFAAPIICELSKRKIFRFSKNKAVFDLDQLKKIKSKKELKACLNYLIRINLLNKVDKENYEFTNLGTEIFKRANSYYVPHSYREYILNLSNILDKKINLSRLKVDRDENIIGSGLTHMRYFPPVLSYFAREEIETVVDIGCGNGHFLNLMNNNFENLNLVGFDMSSVSVKAAKKITKNKSNKLFIFKEDASKIAKWEKKIRNYTKGKKTVFFFWFLLHEISNNKKSVIINFLKDVKKKFPNSKIVICELTKQSKEIFEINSEKTLMPEYLLFHDFSGQGVLSFLDYKDILSQTGYSLKKEWLFDKNQGKSEGQSEPSTFVWILE